MSKCTFVEQSKAMLESAGDLDPGGFYVDAEGDVIIMTDERRLVVVAGSVTPGTECRREGFPPFRPFVGSLEVE